MTLVCAFALAGAAPGPTQPVSLIEDGDFEHRPVDLMLTEVCSLDNEVAHSGRRSLKVEVPRKPGAVTSGTARWMADGFERGETYTVSVWMRTEDVVMNEGRNGFAYVAMYQHDQFGDYVSFKDFAQLTGDNDWQRHTYTFTVAGDTTRLEFPCGTFQASGSVWFDDFTLVRGTEAADIDEIARSESAPEYTGKPGIAIVKDDLPVAGEPSDPDYLKEILDGIEGRPYEVTLISAEDLADRKVLSPRRFDMVILPCGESFPAPAANAFRRFLRAGGDMITMGGYAFDNLVDAEEQEPAEPPPQECSWHYRIPVTPGMGKNLTFEGHLRCRSVTGAGFAYLAVYQYAADGKLVAWKDTIQLTGDRDWTASKYGFDVAEGVAHIDIKIGLYRCTGTASFDDISVKDEQGQELVGDPGFESVTDPDEPRDHAWFRTQPELASITTAAPRSGEHCAKAKLAAAEQAPLIMNTARGAPGDSLKIGPAQIGVFDAQFPLKRVDHATAAPDQFIVPQDFIADSPIEGWAAVTVLGYNDARRIPLIDCYDRYGRLRGSAASITYRYAGHYARSSWAIFGADNFDFFPRGAPAARELLAPVVEALITETFLHNLETDYASYRQGESVEVRVNVSNFGAQPQDAAVTVRLFPNDGDRAIALPPLEADVPAETTAELTTRWEPGKLDASFYRVEAELELGGKPHDRMETGFCVWDEQVARSGPDCVLEDNLFRLNGREHFLQGTDSFSFTFNSAHENPLVWKRDFETMRDSAMNLPENLQVNSRSQSPPYEWPEPLLRKIDAMVQLAQQHGQVYMPGLLIGHNVVVEDDVMEREAAWVQAFVKRYKDVPGIIWYINGDFQLRIGENIQLANERGGEIPRTDVERLWNELLQRKYSSDDELKASWGEARVTGPLGRVPLDDYGSGEWDDMRAVDMAAFKVELMRRWINRHVRAIREVDTHHAITSEYYRAPSSGIDIVWAIGDHACANIGYFDRPDDDIARFPASMRFADLRARGKSMSAGEFGCKTHPAWGDGQDYGYHITRSDEQQEELWCAITHYGWGLGASKIHNWDWKDNVEWVFPWGMVYPGDWVKKDCLDVYRAAGLVFRQFERRYEEPSVYVLTPDSHRLGEPVWTVFEATLSCFNTLHYMGIDVGTLNECALEEIPESAEIIFYPIPYQIPDDVYAKLLDWVKAGGTLYVSGDVSYDRFRRRTLTERLEELCGVEFVAERYPNIACDPEKGLPTHIDGELTTVNPAIVVRRAGARVLIATEDEDKVPILLVNQPGKGRVVFCTWPLERDQGFAEGIVYRNGHWYLAALDEAGIRFPTATGAWGPALPVTVPLAGEASHGDAYVNPTDEEVEAWTSRGEVELALASNRTGLAVWGKRGELLALEEGSSAHFITYALDHGDVRVSKRLCVLPLTEGRIKLETRADWKRPVAVVGEVIGGKWVEYERIDVRPRGGSIRIPIDQDRCFSIILVTEEERAQDCARRLARSLTEPWRALPRE